jgi:hypothetical protein
MIDYARTIFLQGMAEKITRRIAENVARSAYTRFGLADSMDGGIDQCEFVEDAVAIALGEESGCLAPEELTAENCELLFVEAELQSLFAEPVQLSPARLEAAVQISDELLRITEVSDGE